MASSGEYQWDHRGLPIFFPCTPYPSQKSYTEKVLDCLLDAQNGLLESPTGTGKTLALLCGSLAWQQTQKARMTIQDSVNIPDMPNIPGADNTPRVFYSSRTHSQLAQVMAQFKSLESSSTAVALGSRDQLCVHPAVRQKTSVAEKNRMCNFLVKAKQCEFYNNYTRTEGSKENCHSTVQDIEDLVKSNTKRRVCPYYRSRESSSKADFIFLPYNYLIDRSIRKSLPANLSNSLVIIDEAHNVAKVCEESASLGFESQDIAIALSEVDAIVKVLEDKSNSDIDVEQLTQDQDISAEDCLLIKEALMNLEDTLAKRFKENKLKVNDSYPGDVLMGILEESSMDFGRFSWILNTMQTMIDVLGSLSSMGAKFSGKGLETMMTVLKIVYSDRSLAASSLVLKKYYNLHISKSPKRDTNFVFNVWCFHPGLAMRSIIECGTRSLILTSGTLKPMTATAQELDIPFGVQFSGPHVIGEKQILVKTIPKGVDNVDLISVFQNRTNNNFLISLGKTIYELMRLVPNGMLVFFPSYSLMEICVDKWKASEIWHYFNKVKTVVIEPKDKLVFEQTIAEYKKRAEDKNGPGACLMAVCRGKIAEGIDFSDSMARAVVITGIPFPNTYDARIKLKKDYVDKRKIENPSLPSGNEWYKLEAYRAINQAVGRVIRHKNDFGAIYLLDKRFSDVNVVNSLSDWASKNASSVSLTNAINSSTAFFKELNVAVSRSESKSMMTKVGSAFDTTNKAKRKINVPVVEVVPKKQKKIVIKRSNNILRYNAATVIQNMKTKLSKEDMDSFKSTLKSYKNNKDIKELLKLLTIFYESDKLNKNELSALKEFVLETDSDVYDKFLQLRQ